MTNTATTQDVFCGGCLSYLEPYLVNEEKCPYCWSSFPDNLVSKSDMEEIEAQDNIQVEVEIDEELIVGTCSFCKIYLHEDEASMDFCPGCKVDLDSAYQELSDEDFYKVNNITPYEDPGVNPEDINLDILIPCPACKTGSSRFGEAACPDCGVPYSGEYWKTVYQELLEQDDEFFKLHVEQPIESDLDTIVDFISEFREEIRLCCNRFEDQCECDIPIEWGDVENGGMLDEQTREDVYEYDSPCSGCVHYYAQTCMAYRGWLVNFYKDAESPGQIDYCDHYFKHPSITTVKVSN